MSAVDHGRSALLQASATAQARAIARGDIEANALLRLQVEAIDRLNPQINAFIARAQFAADFDASLQATVASPLAGSCFAVKDNFDVAGLPTAAGLRAFARAAQADAPVVARRKAAGLHCLGKLNMHPMALGATNHNADYGDCHNPVRASHTPGGSSGGSGAAVAAGLCAIALGTDTMGSVRIPAAYCGVVGFKPSHETLGLEGVVPLASMLDHIGILARSVGDVTLALQIAAPHLAHHAPARVRDTPPRLGVVQDLQALGVSPDVEHAFLSGVRQIQEATGAVCVPITLSSFDLSAQRRAGLLLCEAELHPLLAPLIRDQPSALPVDLLAMMRYIERKSAIDLGQALSQIARAAQRFNAFFTDIDAMVLPTAPQVAFRMDEPVPPHQADLTALANMNGAPAISLPLAVSAGALPVGLQLVGHRGDDLTVLAWASRIEQALAQA